MFNFRDLNIYSSNISSCADEVIKEAKKNRNCLTLTCINPHSFVVAKRDNVFAKSLKYSNWLIPDGIGIVKADLLFSKKIKNRLTGPDFYNTTMKELDKVNGSVAYIGSTEKNLMKIKAQVSKKYKNITITTMISPPFSPSFEGKINDSMIEKINKHSPDILWVGMTAPKQEKWIFDNKVRLDVGVAAAVGAVFDFAAGNITRAPLWMQNFNLEWLHRFLKNPIRLAKRTFVSAPLFIAYVVYEKFFL